MTENDLQDERIKENKDKLYEVAERTRWLEEHYNKFNSEMGEVQTNVKWISKMMWWHIGITVGGLGGVTTFLIYLVEKIK